MTKIAAEPEEAPVPGTAARRKRSTGFPVVSLAEASSILKDAGKYGFEHSISAFASYMGHSTTNSGAFRQRIAAFRDWKLITGRGDRVAMTDVARMIALPTDADAEHRALQEAFKSCSVFAKLYDNLAKGQPLARTGLGNQAVHDLGVGPNSVNKFVESFVDSAVAAGFAEVADDGKVALLSSQEEFHRSEPSGDYIAPLSQGAPARLSSSSRTGTPVVHQTWSIGGGSIVFEIRTEHPLPASAFATVGEVVASLERLAETLTPESPEADVRGEEEVAG